MSSLALSLKYRPKLFSDLVGQETISQTLSMALDKDRIVHAYLFSGLRGSGKTSSARIFARALECENGPTSTPCGECATCLATLGGRNIDIIEMDAASNRSIDSIRDLIEQTKYVPTMSRYKIFIIDEVHMLTKEAFNALLKTLEEPPAYVKFILATTDPLKLPATILSRTQHFRFKKIAHKAVIAHLEMILQKEEVGYEMGALDIIARSGGGSLRDTLTLTDQAINYCDKYLTIEQVAQMLGIVDPKNLRDFFSSIMHDDEQGIIHALEILGEYECEMVIDEMLIFLKDMLLSGSKDFSLLVIDRFLGILSQAKSLLNLNPDGAFVLLLMSLKMREAMKLQDISQAISTLESTLAQAPSTPSPNKQSPIVEPTSAQQPSQKPSSVALDSTPKPQAPSIYEQAFSQLVGKITDRSYELGEAFKRAITFKQFIQAPSPSQSATLLWESSGDEQDKALLRQHFGLIREFAQEIFAPHSQSQITIKNITQTPQADVSKESIPPETIGLNQPQEPASTSSTQASNLSLDSRGSHLKDPNALESSLEDSATSQPRSLDSTPPLESKKLKPSDLILYSTQEIRPDHISDAVYDEVPWEREGVGQEESFAQGSQTPSSQEVSNEPNEPNPSPPNPQQKDMTQAFKDNNQALIDGIKQHFGVTSMIVEAPTRNDS